MIYPVKEFLQIKVYDPSQAVLDVSLSLFDGVMRALSRAKTVAVSGEMGVKNRIHDL
ncbi:hypothetical protein D1872_288680 [compost metagenome]